MTSIKDLKALGAFVTDAKVQREIKFEIDGQEYDATIHVRRLSAGDYETLFLVDKEDRSRTAKVISEAITLGDDGKERIKFEDAYKLHPSLAAAMVNAFNEVNTAKKSSRPATGSSAT